MTDETLAKMFRILLYAAPGKLLQSQINPAYQYAAATFALKLVVSAQFALQFGGAITRNLIFAPVTIYYRVNVPYMSQMMRITSQIVQNIIEKPIRFEPTMIGITFP